MLALAACKPEEPPFLSDGSPFGAGHLIDNVAVGANGTLHLRRQTAPGKGKGDPGRYGDVAFTDARSTSPHVLEVGELSPANGTFHVRGLAEGTAGVEVQLPDGKRHIFPVNVVTAQASFVGARSECLEGGRPFLVGDPVDIGIELTAPDHSYVFANGIPTQWTVEPAYLLEKLPGSSRYIAKRAGRGVLRSSTHPIQGELWITDVSEIDGLKLGSGTIFLRNQPAYEQLRVRVGGKAPCGDVFPLGVRTRSETPDVCESSAVNDRGYFPINMHRAGLCRITAELPEARRGEGVTASTTFTVVSQ